MFAVIYIHTKVYKAEDNACISSAQFLSRVNQATFTLTSGVEKIVAVCEDRSLTFIDLDGNKVIDFF